MKEAARGPPGAPVYETRRGTGCSPPPWLIVDTSGEHLSLSPNFFTESRQGNEKPLCAFS